MSHKIALFDSHMHIIDPQFPLVANNGYLPKPFTCEDYVKRTERFNVVGGAVVSGSFQAFDQSYLIAALNTLGTGFVGVTQLPHDVSDAEIIRLSDAGVRALRFNLYRGGSEELNYLSTMAHRVNELVGWHVELYVDSNQLDELSDQLLQLPAVSIDHLGLKKEGFSHLLKLVEKDVKVKATGFGRIDFDAAAAMKDLYHANPDALMFGTDLPSTRAKVPFQDSDLNTVIDTLGPEAARKVLSSNAVAFYKVKGRQVASS